MSTATATELPPRSLRDLPEHKVEEVIVDTANHDSDLLKNTTELVRVIDPSHTLNQATPAASAPIPATPELEAVGAKRVGSEDSDVGANIEHALKLARSGITGESIWARLGKAIRGVNILNRKKAQKAKMGPEDYKSVLDIGS